MVPTRAGGGDKAMRGRSWALVWLLLCSGVWTADTAAQDISYVRKSRFNIPFTLKDSEIPLTREVQLYLSDDQGRSWRIHKVASPRDGAFPFQTDRDGPYWFLIRTLSTDGQFQPPSLDGLGPDLRVVVDTRPPQITLQALPAQGDLVGVSWDVADENLDLASLTLEARAPGGDWQPIDMEKTASGRKYWSAVGRGDMEVRLRARDRAGNSNTGFTALGAATGRVGGAAAQGYESNPNRTPSPSPSPGLPNVMYVNRTDIQFRFQLEEVGPSGIGGVEFWYTRDGQNWKRYGEDPNREAPLKVEDQGENVKLVRATLPAEGPYGIILQAKSGVGLSGPAPQRGDRPMLWLEVDLTKPAVQILSAQASRSPEGTVLTVHWKASDKHLDQGPITLGYSETKDGPWTIIEKNLDNTGRFVWRVPPEAPYRFYLRVEARDKANNVGVRDTEKPVVVDLTQPRIKLLGVEPSGGQAGGSGGSISIVPP